MRMSKKVYFLAGTIMLALGFVAVTAFISSAETRDSQEGYSTTSSPVINPSDMESALKDPLKRGELESLLKSRGDETEEGFRNAFREVYGFDLNALTRSRVPNEGGVMDPGGPDPFGYSFKHCTFNYVFLNPGDNPTQLGEDQSFDINLPFTFPFYGQSINTIRVSSNGYITVPPEDGTDFTNDPIPSGNSPNNLIAPFWEDLSGSFGPADREIRYAFRLAGSVDTLILQWHNWGYFGNFGSKQLEFEVRLLSNGCITFQYQNVDSTIAFGPQGATAGIEDANGAIGLQVAFNNPGGNGHIAAGVAICICPELEEPELVEVDFDIKPQSCPNPLNTKSKGVLPVAILGSASLDVNDIDVSTVKLVGVSPIRNAFEDVATPFDGDLCGCTTEGADGFGDLTLKFDRQAIIAALGSVNDGDSIKLTMTGELNDGTPIEGKDCVVIRKKKGGGPNSGGFDFFEPTILTLFQNSPNPFRSGTTIRFSLPEDGYVTLTVHDVTGSTVATLVDHELDAGTHTAEWGSYAASGIYFYRLQAGNTTLTRKMILLR
ncbi:T9SS type A sorting domain-containing protein [candidate division TA06 bacterium]|nr:T9SS type A sorting domain-containing protein [candidate division TA06 bacterium]